VWINQVQCIKDVQPLLETDKATLRDRLIPAMIALSGTEDKAIRAQIAESVALIAELDFPTKWVDLIDVRSVVSSPTHGDN
jgi:exportin-2 (importin alpha re-exporter)